MALKKNIQLTDDPLTNIHIMVPMLNDEARKAMSYMMYGCFLGAQLADNNVPKDGITTGQIMERERLSKKEVGRR
ncbi:MAG: hypothetical protein HDR71_15590 [Lachnospiraceae bacterium]|nr:hypothetical protein [Lachnospiraceae bacterium]